MLLSAPSCGTICDAYQFKYLRKNKKAGDSPDQEKLTVSIPLDIPLVVFPCIGLLVRISGVVSASVWLGDALERALVSRGMRRLSIEVPAQDQEGRWLA